MVIGSSAVLARHRVENAADLAALAAAQQIGLGTDPCGWASRVAGANGVSLRLCLLAVDVDGRSGSVTIAVATQTSFPVLGGKTVDAVSKAERQP